MEKSKFVTSSAKSASWVANAQHERLQASVAAVKANQAGSER